jgi:hypothetical protein
MNLRPKRGGLPAASAALMAFDGSTISLQDTLATTGEFGRLTKQSGEAAWLLARFAGLVACGNHPVFAASPGGWKDSEIKLAK